MPEPKKAAAAAAAAVTTTHKATTAHYHPLPSINKTTQPRQPVFLTNLSQVAYRDGTFPSASIKMVRCLLVLGGQRDKRRSICLVALPLGQQNLLHTYFLGLQTIFSIFKPLSRLSLPDFILVLFKHGLSDLLASFAHPCSPCCQSRRRGAVWPGTDLPSHTADRRYFTSALACRRQQHRLEPLAPSDKSRSWDD